MNKAVARSIEALTGGVPLALGGAAAGAATYEPKNPREWQDDAGRIHRRKLTKAEKKERRTRALRAAALGGGLGASGGLGYGLFKRVKLTGQETRETSAVVGRALAGLQDVIDEDLYPGAWWIPYGDRIPSVKKWKAAKNYLLKQERELTDLLGVAEEARAKRPFGGYRRGGINQFSEYGDELGMDRGSTPWSPETHVGLVHNRLMDLKKQYKLPDPSIDPPGFWNGLLEAKGLTKTASEASFLLELIKLGAG